MKLVYPDYYPRFRCTAGACRHSCCAGWEIDIDDEALARYDGMDGPLGERLRRCIDRGGERAHFRLTEEERCPFLNAMGLCDLILEKGEGVLCQVCADHPRYLNVLPSRTETGLGLCCEAACALILAQRRPVRLVQQGRGPRPGREEAAFLRWRTKLLALAQNREEPVEMRMRRILAACGLALPAYSHEVWAVAYMKLERMNEAWDCVLRRFLESGEAHAPGIDEIAQEQLLVYFLWRHLAAGFLAEDLPGYAAFAVLSTRVILRLCRNGEELPEVARLYSAEIEYSDENVQRLIDWIYESEEKP